MDYETELFDAHEAADGKRALDRHIRTIEPPGMLSGGVPTMTEEEKSERLRKLGTDVVQGVKTAASSAATIGEDAVRKLAQESSEILSDQLQQTADVFTQTIQKPDGSDINLIAPLYDVPQVQDKNEFENFAGSVVQFMIAMGLSPGNLGVKGAVAAFTLDENEGDFAGMLNEYGMLPSFLEFLTSDPEDRDAEGRMRQRLKNVVQEGALAGSIDLVVRSAKQLKRTPDALDRFATAVSNKFIAAGDRADARIAERAADTGVTLGSGVDPTEGADAILSYIGKLLRQDETSILAKDSKKIPISRVRKAGFETKEMAAAAAQTEADRIISLYPESEGWLRPEVQTQSIKPSFSINDKGKIKIRWKEPAYAFHIPPQGKDLAQHTTDLTDKLVSDVGVVLDRARNGDQAAIDIIKQANWYRAMRTRLRKEFGGLGDVFADIVGATSANTAVQQNYDNALIALRKFVRGDYDEAIEIYAKRVEAGETVSPSILNAKNADEDDPFFLIAKDSGAVFGTNSPGATAAMLDMFRQVKKDKAPKTINFTGNLIGFGKDATIDVWAARYLRDAAGLPRIAPPAEKAVAGKHLKESTFDNPKIGSEFGFGQKVFDAAAKLLNDAGEIKEAYPDVGELGADDLQAVVWFMEKEKWTNNGWTSKSGEGGSLDFESEFGGSPDRPRVAELRSIINSINSTPDEIAAARDELETLKGEPQRFIAGVTRARDEVPTDIEMDELAQEVLAPVLQDDKVIGAQANSAIGEFDGKPERSLNYEVVTQTDFDPTNMTKAIVEAGRKYDQDSVFVSKIVSDEALGARPGIEIYFNKRQTNPEDPTKESLVNLVKNALRNNGMEGYTFITDARYGDRTDIKAAQRFGDTPEQYVGVRFQYIPEFDETFDIARGQQILDEKAELYLEVMETILNMSDSFKGLGIDEITFADLVFYDTKVFKNTDREGAEWINGGTSYEEHLGKPVAKSTSEGQNRGQSGGEKPTQTDSSEAVREDL